VRFSRFDVIVAIGGWALLISRLWYGEHIGEDRLEGHVQELFQETEIEKE
jgi:hypothetical protein